MKKNYFSKKISIVGLGYVGLPLAIALSKHYQVVGFDLNDKRIDSLNKNIDISNEVSSLVLESSRISFGSDPNIMANSDIFIVTVPTPIDDNNKPDLSCLEAASKSIGNFLRKGNCVVYESTVYPGVTEDVCVPILEKESSLIFNTDFSVGYSPERLSPGAGGKQLEDIVKVVSASNREALDMLCGIYHSIIPAGIHRASCIKVAEMAKVIENTQRDLNVSLMNELAKICHLINIDSNDVIDAAATKWNFMKMTPGLVGGHCIGVDPYYLTYLARSKGYDPDVILAGRKINNSMAKYIAEQCIKYLSAANKSIHSSKVLIMGLSFKENINDIRNSKVPNIISELHSYGVKTYTFDPLADKQDCLDTYNVELINSDSIPKVDAIICAVGHDIFSTKPFSEWLSYIRGKKIFLDVKGIFKSQLDLNPCNYWCL